MTRPNHTNKFKKKPSFWSSGLYLSIRTWIIFIVLWESIIRLKLVDPFFLQSPSKIVEEAYFMYVVKLDIYPHLWVSIRELFTALVFVLIISIPVGIILGYWRKLNKSFNGMIIAFYAVPEIAILPLIMLWFGIGLTSKVMFIFIAGFFSIVINTIEGVKQTSPVLIEACRSFLANDRQILRKVVIPSALPYILSGVKIAIGRMVIMTIVAEMLASNKGLGYIAQEAGINFNVARLFVIIVTISLLSVILTSIATWLQRIMTPWTQDFKR